MFDVAVVGSANLDLVARAPHIPAPGETLLAEGYAEHAGGKGLNQAVAAARSGSDVVFVGAVGDDAAGEQLRDVLTADGIDASNVTRSDQPTGRALIVVDARGENSIVVVPGANSQVALRRGLPPSRVVLAQLEIPIATVIAAFAAAREAGALTVLNPAPAAPLPDELLANCNVVVPNESELRLLGGADELARRCGGAALVVTRGGDGVDIYQAGDREHVTAFDVDVVDTTGAGDAFCGALACRLAAGDALRGAVRWAAAAGALATTVHGAVPAQPTARSIRALLAQRDQGRG